MYFWNANSIATFIFLILAGTNLTVISCIPIKEFSTENKKNSSEITRLISKKESSQISARIFEPWLHGKHGVGHKPFNISEFIGGVEFHPYELAHLYEGDVKGISGHQEIESDGKKHFRISIWPNGVVPYVLTGPFDEIDVAAIKTAIKEYHENTCIRFIPRKKEISYLKIQSTSTGCWSFVGQKEDGSPQEVNLESPNCIGQSTIIHELMHALGFIHEQNRPDRDKYINLYLKNIRDPKLLINFDIHYNLYEDLGIKYDIGSVMQYDETSFAKKNTKTMIAKNGGKLGNAVGFAKSDIREINRLYQCKGPQYSI